MDSDTPSLHEEIIVNEDLRAFIDPLTPEEDAALEQSLLTEGCRDALVLWGQVLVDGHNRFRLCRKHGLPFRTVQNPRFKSLEDVQLWMIDQHLGRRSLSNFQRGVLALRKRELLTEKKAQRMAALAEAPSVSASEAPQVTPSGDAPWDGEATLPAGQAAPAAPLNAMDSREDIAKAARLSSTQVQMIEKIQKQAAPEVVAAVRSGELSINAAAAVATLPAEEQVAAAHAGSDELKQVAKRVRDAKRKPKTGTMADPTATGDTVASAASSDSTEEAHTVEALRQRVAALEAENAELRHQLDALRAAAQPG